MLERRSTACHQITASKEPAATKRKKLARPGGLELPTFWFVARRSIQLSYGRAVDKYYHRLARRIQPPQEFTFCTRKASEATQLYSGSKQGWITRRIRPLALGRRAQNFGYALRSRARAGPPASVSSPLRSRQWRADSRNECVARIEWNLSARPAKSPTDRRGRALGPAPSPQKAHSSAPGSRPRLLALLPASEMPHR